MFGFHGDFVAFEESVRVASQITSADTAAAAPRFPGQGSKVRALGAQGEESCDFFGSSSGTSGRLPASDRGEVLFRAAPQRANETPASHQNPAFAIKPRFFSKAGRM